MTLKVSVIVCAHNEAEFLSACLHSLLAQSRLPDEILVINNASIFFAARGWADRVIDGAATAAAAEARNVRRCIHRTPATSCEVFVIAMSRLAHVTKIQQRATRRSSPRAIGLGIGPVFAHLKYR